MMRGTNLICAAAVLLALAGQGGATEFSEISDIDLFSDVRTAVENDDAVKTLRLMQEMQKRGIGIFAEARGATCKEEIELPKTITDWRFSGAARQAYITASKRRQIELGSCGCIFKEFSFEDFTDSLLQKEPASLENSDRSAFETYLKSSQTDVDIQFRELEVVCRKN